MRLFYVSIFHFEKEKECSPHRCTQIPLCPIPLDLIFIVDVSSSVLDDDYGGLANAGFLVQSLIGAIERVINANEARLTRTPPIPGYASEFDRDQIALITFCFVLIHRSHICTLHENTLYFTHSGRRKGGIWFWRTYDHFPI